MSIDDYVVNFVDMHEKNLTEVARAIWDNPEVALHEFFAAKLLSGELEQAGFRVEMGIGQLPTAFVASWGSGMPIIGILAEYDALPGLSQEVSAIQKPVKENDPGHGCGHNLFGAGSLGAALAVKEAMEKDNIQGTVRYYGCPAEETVVGKVFMAKEGVFDDLSAALAWHPGYGNGASGNCSSLAVNSFKVNFHGTASHAGAAPHLGRSALDGVMLMDVGVNYLREHVEPEVRLHCVVTHGGDAPNIVPPYAQVWYYVRAPRREQVEQVYTRILDIVRGAALMSGTSFDIDFLTGCYEVLPNLSIDGIISKKMGEIGAPRFLDEDVAFAKQLQKSIPPQVIEMSVQQILKMSGKGVTRDDLGLLLCHKIILSISFMLA